MRAGTAKPQQSLVHNRLLAGLEPDDFGLLADNLVLLTLPKGTELASPDHRIEYVYFLESGVASIVVASEEGLDVEVGLVGYEGMAPSASILGAPTTSECIMMQIEGAAWRLPTSVLNVAMNRPALRRLFNLFVETLIVQTRQTTRSNVVNRIEERLARWLLMCADRMRSARLTITQEYLAIMLGVRRASVSEALSALAARGLVQARRGVLVLTDRLGLEKFAGETYGQPEETYRQLIGDPVEPRGQAALKLDLRLVPPSVRNGV